MFLTCAGYMMTSSASLMDSNAVILSEDSTVCFPVDNDPCFVFTIVFVFIGLNI